MLIIIINKPLTRRRGHQRWLANHQQRLFRIKSGRRLCCAPSWLPAFKLLEGKRHRQNL